MEALLKVNDISMVFGGLRAVSNFSMEIKAGELIGLIGPNGAGKTTMFNSISGFYPPTSGSVFFEGKDITGLPSYEVCRLGLARTFQIVQTLKEMTVEENVMTGAFLHTRSTRAARAAAREILELVGMSGKRDILGGSLTIVDKKRLEIARALATKPKLLMLDECMAGLNQTEIKDVMNLCLKLRENGLSLLIVEHIMEAIMPISDRIVVLNAGKKIAEGVPKEIADNDEVIKAYLGDRYHAKSRKS